MRLSEYEGKQLAAKSGIPIPRGRLAKSSDEAAAAAEEFAVPVVIKSQILTGGRGKAGGIKFADHPDDAKKAASELINSKIKDQLVKVVLVEDKLDVKEEYYMGITIDEIGKCDIAILGKSGGVEVEDAAAHGKAFARVKFDPFEGLLPFKAKQLAQDAGFSGKTLNRVTGIAVRLYELYTRFDASLAEINPLVLTADGSLVAADMRVDIDDDALGRQEKTLKELGIERREDRGREPTELETEASRIDNIDHRGVAGRVVEFDGDIAMIIGGGGASLTVFDAVLRHGGKPANYCEIGGNPTVRKIEKLTELIIKKPGIKKLAVVTNVLSNTRVDLVARGVIKGLLSAGIDPKTFPIVFRVPGSWEDDGFKILEKYNIKYFDRTHTMDEAAKYIVGMG